MTFMDRPSSENSDNMNNMNGGVEPSEVMGDDEDYDFVQYIEDEELIEVPDNNENDMDDEDSDADNEMDMLTDSHPVWDDADFVFSHHTGAIFCCHLDPKTNSLAVTGSEDEKAYVWNTSSGDILFECSNHKDSVTAAEFSHDGTYLATGDMSGVIQVWKVATKTCVWNNAIGDLSWMKWHPSSAVLFAAAASGEVYMWKIPSGECKIFPSHGVSSECGQIMPDGRRAAFGYSDGSVRVYDLKSCDSLATFKAGEAHSGTVYCMDIHPDNNMIVSGGGDGLIVLYKSQPGKVLSIFKDAIEDGGSEDEAVPWVEAVKFSPDPSLPLVAAGTLTGELYIWDIAKQAIRNKIDVDCGINRIVWDKQSPAIYASLLDGSVKIFDSRNGTLKSQLYGHKNHILDASLSQDGNLLLTASEDKTARVFSLSTPDR